MKFLFLLGSLLLAQSTLCDDGSVTTKSCEDYLGAERCTYLRNLAVLLHQTPSIIADALKDAVKLQITTAMDMFVFVKNYMKDRIICGKIIGNVACNKLVEITKKLKEQRSLINEAIMDTLLKHTTNIKDIIVNVTKTIVERVETTSNLKCGDILTENQCKFLNNAAIRFKLKKEDIRNLIIEVIANGTLIGDQIYKRTIGSIVEKVRDLKCKDFAANDVCDVIMALAQNFHVKVQFVKDAIATAIIYGATTSKAIIDGAKRFLIDIVSCDNYLPKLVCGPIEGLAIMLHVSFDKVIGKIRSLVATGVSIVKIPRKVIAYIWDLFFGNAVKRSLDISSFTDKLMKYVEKVISIGKDVKEKLKAEIKQLIEKGKVTIFNAKKIIDELIAKYGPQSDDSYDADVHKSIIDQLKEALKKAHGKAKEKIEKLLAKSKEQLEKLKEYIKTLLGGQDHADAVELTHNIIADMARRGLDDELTEAEENVEKIHL